LKSAQLNNRKWIGIDQSEHALKATIQKLQSIEVDIFSSRLDYDFVNLEKP
jgi:adenine-specific DNA-methyltransferase